MDHKAGSEALMVEEGTIRAGGTAQAGGTIQAEATTQLEGPAETKKRKTRRVWRSPQVTWIIDNAPSYEYTVGNGKVCHHWDTMAKDMKAHTPKQKQPNGERAKKNMKREVYYTPETAFQIIKPYITNFRTIWDPAAGEDIFPVKDYFSRKRYRVVVTDISMGEDKRKEFIKRVCELKKAFARLVPVNVLESKTIRDLLKKYKVSFIFPPKTVPFSSPDDSRSVRNLPYSLWLEEDNLPTSEGKDVMLVACDPYVILGHAKVDFAVKLEDQHYMVPTVPLEQIYQTLPVSSQLRRALLKGGDSGIVVHKRKSSEGKLLTVSTDSGPGRGSYIYLTVCSSAQEDIRLTTGEFIDWKTEGDLLKPGAGGREAVLAYVKGNQLRPSAAVSKVLKALSASAIIRIEALDARRRQTILSLLNDPKTYFAFSGVGHVLGQAGKSKGEATSTVKTRDRAQFKSFPNHLQIMGNSSSSTKSGATATSSDATTTSITSVPEYVKVSDLNTSLQKYLTASEFESSLAPYVKTTDLLQYAKTADLSQYAKSNDLSQYAKSNDLSQYAKESDLTTYAPLTSLTSYVKPENVAKALKVAVEQVVPGSCDGTKCTLQQNLALPVTNKVQVGDYGITQQGTELCFTHKDSNAMCLNGAPGADRLQVYNNANGQRPWFFMKPGYYGFW
ncbi:hypothetical protein HDV00_012785 [Rhizophlyctis rosea]|nr:hypothetical protein HDV00_012785 [Rhizophlyctis rosea]